MDDLIYLFDGGGRWAFYLAVILVLFVGAIWAVLDKRSFLWKDDSEGV